MLLTRDEFREAVFARDKHLCVVCEEPAVDAHHILERRLFKDGGYYLNNGASVCAQHHMMAETTSISVERLRELAGITKPVIPEHFYNDQIYDKWGNPIFANGTRAKGELFHDESVQKILRVNGALLLFSNRVKYPRTYHLPWSLGLTKDDRVMDSDVFEGRDVVVHVKMDGENTTMYSNGIHARSLDSGSHPSRDRVKAMHAAIAHDIPEGYRICGENLYAKHSIKYENLESYFLMFSMWNAENYCLGWNETYEWAKLLELKTVDAFYIGTFDKAYIHKTFVQKYGEVNHEGYVIRLADKFHYSQFRNSVGKYVRKNHIHTHGHWMRETIEPNGLVLKVDDLEV